MIEVHLNHHSLEALYLGMLSSVKKLLREFLFIKGVVVFKENPLLLVVDSIVFNLVSSFAIDLKKHCSSCFNYYTVHTSSASDK